MKNEFICIKKPERPNWITFRFALKEIVEALDKTQCKPSIKQQGIFLKLLNEQMKQVLGYKEEHTIIS